MKVSIITATYNSASTLTENIHSVQSQTYKDIEHIIIDGASTDDTVSIAKSFSHIRFISEPDRGIYDALNKGIECASGDIIGFLHSDDLFSDRYTIEHITEAFSRHEADGVYGDLLFVESATSHKVVRTWKSSPFKKHSVQFGWMPPHPTLFLHKNIYAKFGLFSLDYKISGDYDFLIRVMKDRSLNLHYLPEVITYMRVGGVSTGQFRKKMACAAEDYRVLKHNRVSFPLFAIGMKSLRIFLQRLKKSR